MSGPAWVAFVVAGALGSLTRFRVDGVVGRLHRAKPWGTLAVNVTGSLALGVLTGLRLYHGLSATPSVVLGTGFCGAYTTFSTFTLEAVGLALDGGVGAAGPYIAGTVGACLAAAALGIAVTALL